MRRLHLLIHVLGRRAGLTFGVVTLLTAALLATVDITSRHALKLYVEDQLQRIPWDLAIYQRSAGSDLTTIQRRLQAVDGLQRVESLTFLRARFPDLTTVSIDVGGKPLTTPWLSLLAATDPSLLPTGELRDAPGAVLALVGPERAMGAAFLALQGARTFKLGVKVNDRHRVIFETPLGAVVRVDRDELNRWVMDQTGSVTYIPYIGVILMMPFDAQIITRFDSVASGILPPEVVEAEELEEGHIPLAEYEPEVAFLGRLDRSRLISGWDISGSLARVTNLTMRAANIDHAAAFVVDSTTHVLLQRMDGIARLVGIVTVLVTLPLLWMGWVLAANLCALLMLNERRKLGLLRLRGVPGRLMGRAFLLAVAGGGTLGGIAGLLMGSVGPLAVYERGRVPLDVLANSQQLMFAAGFFAVSIVLALAVSHRLIRYATTISPLEASRRVSQSEIGTGSLRFGPLQTVALLLGLYTLVLSWILGQPLSQTVNWAPVRVVDRLLTFIGLPLLLYGVATLLVSKRATIQSVLDLLVRPIGGSLGHFAVRHLSVKPHRTAAFLLIVALMASVTLYPTVTSRSFADKAERGARVQLGGDLQLLFNAPDLVDVDRLRGSLEEQLRALTPAVEALVMRVKQAHGVTDATFLYEAVLPQFYLPGYGLKGVPLFLVGEPERYMQRAYSESVVGLSDSFANVMRPLPEGQVAASPPVADFWKLEPGLPLLVGMDRHRAPVDATASGILAYLPGIPPRSVMDRQGYVQARIDYLNHLFNSNAYLVAAAGTRQLQRLELLIPRVIVLAWTGDTGIAADVKKAVVSSLPSRPLEVHDLAEETAKVGTDMFIALALANLRIYLFGGLLLAAIAILAIAVANYTEDKRTLALLRIRGVAPRDMRRFLLSTLLSPAALGLIVGGVTALLGGFGLANYVWELREIRTVVQLLPTHLRTSWTTVLVSLVLVVLLVGVALSFSWWVYRRTASQRVREA